MIFGKKKLSGWGIILLGIWLIAFGAMALLEISFKWDDKVMAILAIAAGVLILLDR